MKLVADSGSTKTDWRLLKNDGSITAFQSEGINPYFHTSQSIAQTLLAMKFEHFEPEEIQEVYFYSAGSSTVQNKQIMHEGFAQVFVNSSIEILHDLLGAARALFRNESGIAGILGTGSNACLFVNEQIKLTLGGHGYILGDEGSGMHIGRKVIRDFMSDLMPAEALALFNEKYKLTKDQITQAVYKELFPNRFLASFSKIVLENIEMEYFRLMADDAFMKYFERYIIQFPDYQKYPIRIVGSVGYYFSKQINDRASKYGIEVQRFLKAPIEGLVAYHS